MTPLAAALSIFFCARRNDSWASSEPAVNAFLVRVFSSLRTALLRAADLALVRFRFFWLLMFATNSSFATGPREDNRAAPPAQPRTRSGWKPAGSLVRGHGARPHPQLLDHRSHRPRQVDAVRSHPRNNRCRRPARHA